MTLWPWPAMARRSMVRSESLSSTRRMGGKLSQPAGRRAGLPGFFLNVVDRFGLFVDVLADAILLSARGLAVVFHHRSLRGVARVGKVGIERVQSALERIEQHLVVRQGIARRPNTGSPVLLVLRRLIGCRLVRIRLGRIGWLCGRGCRRGLYGGRRRRCRIAAA